MPDGATTPGTTPKPRTSPAASEPPGFQLPQADIAQATQPSLWDGVDLAAFGVERAETIAGYKWADRMLLTLSLVEVSATARIIATIVAWHGWVAYVSLDRLAQLSRLDKGNVSRAIRELNQAGIWRTSKTRKRNRTVTQYAFSGMAIAATFCAVRGEKWDCQIDNPGRSRDCQIDNPGQSGIVNLTPEPGIPFSSNPVLTGNPERRRVKKSGLEEKRTPAGKPADSPPAGSGRPDVDSREKPPSEDVPPPPAAAQVPPSEDVPPPRRVTEPPKPAYHPDFPPESFQPGYCQAMLEKYRKTWLDSWKKPIGDVVRWYSTRWDKFLVDLSRHRANELDNRPYGDGLPLETDCADPPEPKIEPLRCEKCGELTVRPRGQRLRIGNEIVVDGCYECSPPPEQPPLKDMVNRNGGV